MNILVTGSDGFLGSKLIELLMKNNNLVVGVDSCVKYGDTERVVNNNYIFIKQDVKNTKKLIEIMEKFRINIVVSTAAIVGGVKINNETPYDMMIENLKIDISVYDACLYIHQHHDFFNKLIMISSSAIFDNNENDNITNQYISDIKVPYYPYSMYKLTSEYMLRSLHNQYGLNYIILRPSNICGVGNFIPKKDNLLNHVIIDLIFKALYQQRNMKIIGDGKQQRQYTHVNDVCQAIYICITRPDILNIELNVSSSKIISISNILDIIWKKIYSEEINFDYRTIDNNVYDIKSRTLDTKKTEEILNYRCDISIDDIITEMIDWIKCISNNIERTQ